MTKYRLIHLLADYKRSLVSLALVVVLLSGSILPLIIPQSASAAGELEPRSLSISSGEPSQTGVQYQFTFTPVATSTLQSLMFQACTTAIGTCTAPSGLSFTSAAWVSQSGWQGAVNFVAGAGSGSCTASASIICANRTSATNQTATAHVITFGTITNPSAINTAFFVRITTFQDNAYTTIQDTGTTAAATIQSLTVDAAVAEILNFCIGATTVNDATTNAGGASDNCSTVTGTTVNLGVLDTGHVSTTPVSTNCVATGCSDNGEAMLLTNAINGATVSYDAIQAGSGSNHLGSLRQTGAACGGSGAPSGGLNPATNTNTDECINSIGSTHAAIVTGTENFGMTVAGINCADVTSYTCTYSTGAYNLTRQTNYNGDGANDTAGFTTDTDQTSGTTHDDYAWDETGTAEELAASTTVVDNEALILKFSATPAVTTPFGAYTLASDYIAVPNY